MVKKRERLKKCFPKEYRILKNLNSPWKIQDYLDSLSYNLTGDTFYSPPRVIQKNKADCFEGAIFAAAALSLQGHKPLIVDLVADPIKDDDHLIAVYQVHGYWGAIAKSKFTGLKFRDSVYSKIRELVLSYFDDYFNERGEKTLVKFSKKPLNLDYFGERWLMSDRIHFIGDFMIRREETSAYEVISPASKRISFRKADPLLLKAGMLGYPKKKN